MAAPGESRVTIYSVSSAVLSQLMWLPAWRDWEGHCQGQAIS